MTLRPRTFTFYSYKGGVGRSMALLNVAYTLHSLGRHVLIVDLDLEAPGVSGFLRRSDELAEHPEDQPDVVDLLSDLMPAIQWELGSETSPEIPPLSKYLRYVREDKFAPAQNPRFRRTRLDVLCASDERDYPSRLTALDITRLSAEDLHEAGNLLREVFFRHQFPWSRIPGAEEKPTCYDYILIDSRTGFTETSGLCIGPLADRLLIFCGLNDQNINGTAEFLKVVGLKTGPRTIRWDDADDLTDTAHAPSLGDKPSLLIATPVPAGEMEMKKERFKIMEDKLGVRPQLSISYHPRLSVLETVFLRDAPEELITQEYRRITDAALALVRDHPAQNSSRLQPFRSPDKEKSAPDKDALLRHAAMLDAEDAGQFAAMQAFAAEQISNTVATKTGAEADALFTAAVEKYQAAVAIKPDFHEALNGLGNALLNQVRQKTGAEADGLFADAVEKYQAALAIKPDFHEALFNWGIALYRQAKQKTGADADALFAAAGEKYQAALANKPDYYHAHDSWGIALSDQAKQKTGAEADALFAASGEKHQAALAIKPDYPQSFNSWGAALSEQAKQKSGAEADSLFAAAEEKFRRALEISSTYSSAMFNLACLAALRGDLPASLRWLEQAKSAGEALTCAKLDGDSDFDRIRDTAEFRTFRDGLPL